MTQKRRLTSSGRGIAKLAVLAGLAGFVFPACSFALGLGSIKVHSALNEPLSAEIEFSSVTDKELKGLNASLATRAEFETAGVERLPYLASIKFTVARKLDGRHILQLNTEQQIDEPFLHLLLQVEWTGGRLVREYSALIDPPQQISAKPRDIEPPAIAPVTPAAPLPEMPTDFATVAPMDAATVAPATEQKSPVDTLPAADAPLQTQSSDSVPAPPGKTDENLFVAAPQPMEAQAPSPAAPESSTGTAAPDTLLGPAGADSKEADAALQTVQPLDDNVQRIEPLSSAAATETAAPRVSTAQAPAWSSVAEYTVRPGDTLWKITEGVRTDKQLTIEQAVLAVYKANRDAFFGNNVNNLRAGKILKIPERESVEDLAPAQARKEFRAQYDVWQEYKLKLASSGRTLKVPDAATPAEAAPVPRAEPAVKAPVAKKEEAPAKKPETATAPAKSPDELLKIVRSNLQDEKKKGTPEKKVADTESAKEAKERQALADRVTTLEETLVSRQIEAKDLAEKIGQVRAQLKKESRLIEIESQTLAQTTKPVPASIAEAPKKPKVEADAPRKAEPTKAEEKKEVPKAADAAKVEAPKKVAEAPKARKDETAKKAPVVPSAPPAEDKGFAGELLDNILGSDMLPLLLGGVVVASAGIAFLYMRRRRKSIAEFEESILTSESIGTDGAPSTTTDTAGQVVSAGDTSFLSDFSQGGMGNIHTDEVDPVAEAEVYLAYGRDETAEEILKDAVVKNPDRNELKIKLLEIYHQRNDIQAFETLAEELYAALAGRRDKNWEKVEEMGRKLNPENPMFRGGAPGAKAAATAAKPAFADTHRGTQPGSTSAAAKVAASGASAEADSSDSINFDFSGLGEEKPKAAGSASMDFDLGGGLDFASGQKEIPAAIDFNATIKTNAADLGMAKMEESPASSDLDSSTDRGMVDFDSGLAGTPANPESASASATSGGGIDFDFDLAASADTGGDAMVAEAPPDVAAEAGSSPQWDETATKLDLAKAYIDMGDAEGARSILDEVMAEGSEAQKKQAKELTAQLH